MAEKMKIEVKNNKRHLAGGERGWDGLVQIRMDYQADKEEHPWQAELCTSLGFAVELRDKLNEYLKEHDL